MIKHLDYSRISRKVNLCQGPLFRGNGPAWSSSGLDNTWNYCVYQKYLLTCRRNLFDMDRFIYAGWMIDVSWCIMMYLDHNHRNLECLYNFIYILYIIVYLHFIYLQVTKAMSLTLTELWVTVSLHSSIVHKNWLSRSMDTVAQADLGSHTRGLGTVFHSIATDTNCTLESQR